MGDFAYIIFAAVAAVILIALISCILEKRVWAAYKGAISVVGAVIFTSCFLGGVLLLCIMLFGGDLTAEESGIPGVGVLIFMVAACFGLSAIPLLMALRKCEKNKKNAALLPAMIVVGMGSIVKFSVMLVPKMAKWMLNLAAELALGKSIFDGAGAKVGFANFYRDDNNEEYQLWTDNGNYAILKDSRGNTFSVQIYNQDGAVSDEKGRLYYPL